IAEGAREKHQRAEHERIALDHPLRVEGRRMKIRLNDGKRDRDDRAVDENEARAEHGRGDDPFSRRRLGRLWLHRRALLRDERRLMPPLTRRELIRTGVAGGALLALGGCAPSPAPSGFDDSAYPYRALSPADRELIAAVGAAMLASALPRGASNQLALVQVVRGVDVAMTGLTPF